MRLIAFVLLVLSLPGYANLAAAQIESQSVLYRYVPLKTPRYVELERTFKASRMLEGLSQLLSAGLRLPQQLTIALAECRTPNAFYDRRIRAVILCYELIDQIGDRAIDEFARKGRTEFAKEMMSGAITFVLMHELGHALVHLLQLPITGREEDVADQIATYLLLGSPNPFYFVQGAAWFNSKRQVKYVSAHFADEHSLDPQRKFNVVCWAFGKDPSRFYGLAQAVKLPARRASRCANEYQQMSRAISTLLGDNVNLR